MSTAHLYLDPRGPALNVPGPINKKDDVTVKVSDSSGCPVGLVHLSRAAMVRSLYRPGDLPDVETLAETTARGQAVTDLVNICRVVSGPNKFSVEDMMEFKCAVAAFDGAL